MASQDSSPQSDTLTLTKGGPLAQRLESSARLSRFFEKLLGEAFHLGADSIHFSCADSMTVSMRRDKSDVKSISIKSSWLAPICNWLADRFSVLSEDSRVETWTIDRDKDEFDFVANVKLGEDVATFSVKTLTGVGRKALLLSGLRRIPRAQLFERLGMTPPARFLAEKILSTESGIVLLCAPDMEQVQKNRAAMLALTKFHYGGDLADSTIRAEIAELSQAEPFFLTVRAEDASDGLLKFKEHGIAPRSVHVAGAICQGFVRRTCPACSRKATVDSKLVQFLPPVLIPGSWDSYCVGRGCETCGQRGQLGVIGVQSIASVDGDLAGAFASGVEQEKLLDVAYGLGTRALLEDGLGKVLSGIITLEALGEVSKTLPNAYLLAKKHATEREAAAKRPTTTAPVHLDADAPLFPKASVAKMPSKPTVLVVEDDSDQRSILDMVFKASNYEVVLTSNGVEALNWMKSGNPDIIISDLMMPEMDGAELVTKLKSNPKFQRIPVLILTVVSDGDKEYSLLDLGADDYCEKTVQRKILLKRVENLIKRNRSAA